MLRTLVPFKTISFRRAALAGILALATATSFVGITAPAAAFGRGGFRFFHPRFGHFHDFGHRFGFRGPGFFPGYYDGYFDNYDGCLRRVWGPYGWRVINVCY